MSEPRFHARVVTLATLMILLSGMSLGQVGQDLFAAVHESLSDAADRALAMSLADKTWMKPSDTRMGSASRASTTANSVGRLRAAVERVNNLRPTIEPILREEGIPAELSAVVLVESGGLTTALSPKGARGVWQFMPDTAQRYGLVVNGSRDDRTDVEKSTRAAGRYLKDLYGQFGDWSLALAAYNAGEPTVRAAMDRSGLRDFGSISEARLLPLETHSYVPAVAAAMKRLQNGNVLGVGRNKSQPAHVVYASTASGK